MVVLTATTAGGFRDAGEPAGSGDVMQIRATIRLLAIGAALAGAAVAGAGNAEASGLHTLYGFCAKFSCGDGYNPADRLDMDASGNLYGVTRKGGVHNSGTAFEVIHPSGSTRGHLRTLYNFCALSNCADGTPSGGLIMDVSGNLYGATYNGGTADAGTIYELIPNAQRTKWQLKTLYSFCSRDSACSDGEVPVGALTYAGAETGVLYDGTSPLFGVTRSGGKGFAGVAFSLTPRRDGHWGLKVRHVFCSQADCADGAAPVGDLTIDGSGNLYGATQGGSGEIFELAPISENKWILTVLYRFSCCTSGFAPNGDLARDSSGNLYGTTILGGAHGGGTIFKVTGVDAETVLYDFCTQKHCRDGENPHAGVFLDEEGNLFGTTPLGGSHGGGILYEWNGSLTVLHRFCIKPGCADGDDPEAPVIMDAAGNLYGTTTGGGGHGGGNVFELVR
jgi:uncharacterized repeat protein (TIGR03803 family)